MMKEAQSHVKRISEELLFDKPFCTIYSRFLVIKIFKQTIMTKHCYYILLFVKHNTQVIMCSR